MATLLKSIELAAFKTANNITELPLYESKAGNKYVIINEEAVMLTRDCDISEKLMINTVSDGNDTWMFIANYREKKQIGTL